jgi:hypothetical protein
MFIVSFLNAISFRVRTAVILAVLAFIASLIASFFSGAVISVIIIRIVVAIIIFATMGYCIGYIISKYVPEILTLFQSDFGEHSEFYGSESGEPSEHDHDHEHGFVGEEDSSFSEMRADDLPHVGGEDSLDPSEGKLGRHIINTEDSMQYEPKLMAQAVRTMMSKDE